MCGMYEFCLGNVSSALYQRGFCDDKILIRAYSGRIVKGRGEYINLENLSSYYNKLNKFPTVLRIMTGEK